MELVSYTPAPTILDEKQGSEHRRHSKEGGPSSYEKYVAIPVEGREREIHKRAFPADSRSISPEVSALLLHSALNSPQEGMTKRSTLLETIASNPKKPPYNENFSKNVRLLMSGRAHALDLQSISYKCISGQEEVDSGKSEQGKTK